MAIAFFESAAGHQPLSEADKPYEHYTNFPLTTFPKTAADVLGNNLASFYIVLARRGLGVIPDELPFGADGQLLDDVVPFYLDTTATTSGRIEELRLAVQKERPDACTGWEGEPMPVYVTSVDVEEMAVLVSWVSGGSEPPAAG